MGVSYLVFELNEKTAEMLAAHKVQPDPSSRYPTLLELRCVIASLEGFTVRERATALETKSVDFEVVHRDGYYGGWSTSIWATKADDKTAMPKDDDKVNPYFHKGSPELAAMILKRLSTICGPLILLRDFDAKAMLVIPGTDPAAAVKRWFYD